MPIYFGVRCVSLPSHNFPPHMFALQRECQSRFICSNFGRISEYCTIQRFTLFTTPYFISMVYLFRNSSVSLYAYSLMYCYMKFKYVGVCVVYILWWNTSQLIVSLSCHPSIYLSLHWSKPLLFLCPWLLSDKQGNWGICGNGMDLLKGLGLFICSPLIHYKRLNPNLTAYIRCRINEVKFMQIISFVVLLTDHCSMNKNSCLLHPFFAFASSKLKNQILLNLMMKRMMWMRWVGNW